MALLTLVKAGNISNLSDARYCAGMGVEIIGFALPAGENASAGVARIKEMAGWLAGVSIALELPDAAPDEVFLQKTLEELQPDYLQIPLKYLDQIKSITTLPLIIQVSEYTAVNAEEQDFVLLQTPAAAQDQHLIEYCSRYQVLLGHTPSDPEALIELLETIKPAGIELKGGTEISPGLKSFDELSEILERLEVED
jgi:phosphoribosylanthranilate isomerase